MQACTHVILQPCLHIRGNGIMKTIAMISQKGGAGKSTLTINLAVAAVLDGKTTAIVDIDPQASTAEWGDQRTAESPTIISAQSSRLAQVMNTAKEQGVDVLFIDTAPHSESAALDAARAADTVIIPTRAAILDLMAINKTVDLIRIAKADAFVALNAVPPRGTLSDEGKEVIAAHNLEVAPVVSYRHAFFHSLTAGQGVLEYEAKGKAAEEIAHLYLYMCKHANIIK